MSLWWVDTRPEAQGDGEPCTVAAPGDGTLIRVEATADQDLPPGPYLVLRVGAAPVSTDVGCERFVGWIGSCTAPPEGTPYL